MSRRTAKVLSRALIAVALFLAVGALAASSATAGHTVSAPIVVGDTTIGDGPTVLADIQSQIANGELPSQSTASVGDLIAFAFALLWLVTGSLIVSRQARNFAGWLFIAIGMGWVVQTAGTALLAWSLIAGRTLPLRGLVAVLGDNRLAPIFLLPLLFLLFPDGRPPSPRWRYLVWVLLAGAAVWAVGYVLSPGPVNNFVDIGILYVNPIGIAALGTAADTIASIGGAVVILAALATVPAVRGRYKRSTGEEHQQLRWLVAVATLAGLLLGLFVLLLAIPSGLLRDNVQNPIQIGLWIGMALTIAVGIPCAYLVAILKHGLWDLDIVIKKTALYAVVAILLVVAFAIGAAVVTGLVGLTGALETNVWPVVGAAIAGVLLWPAVRVARRIADRIVFGGRATPYEVMREFSGSVGGTYATDDVLPRMAQIIASGTGASSARVFLRVGTDLREEASFGSAETGDVLTVPVTHRGEDLGALTVTMPDSDPMNPAKERLIEDLAAQAGPVLRNVRLIEELRASRQRLVAAQDEERRKIERNLHDGVQQQLVAMNVQLGLLARVADSDPTKVGAMATVLQGRATEALEDLRDLARGIYPPLLADKGLTAALQGQARKAAVPTTVAADGIERYPQDVEAAVYFCTLEALNNVAKYAHATAATIELSHDDGHLRFQVRDDGDGFDTSVTAYGTGLQGMADRLDSIGGALVITSAPGEGSTVAGSIPVGDT